MEKKVSNQQNDKTQVIVVSLLILAILLSLTSIILSISLTTSFPEFRFIESREEPKGNIGVVIEEPSMVETTLSDLEGEGFE